MDPRLLSCCVSYVPFASLALKSVNSRILLCAQRREFQGGQLSAAIAADMEALMPECGAIQAPYCRLLCTHPPGSSLEERIAEANRELNNIAVGCNCTSLEPYVSVYTCDSVCTLQTYV